MTGTLTADHTADDTDFDVLVIGAGISGIDAAYHLQVRCADRTFAVLEARPDLGGTWDRRPGARNDAPVLSRDGRGVDKTEIGHSWSRAGSW
ncbi:MAG: FAD-dependent oxidoreductase [Ilumatobacteraceae bacterium]